MNKKTAKIRRELIREIILNHKVRYSRSVDNWWHIVGNDWPDGWEHAPAKSTVKKELYDMCHDQLMDRRFRVRGWFQRELFW